MSPGPICRSSNTCFKDALETLVASALRKERHFCLFKNFVNHSVPAAFISPQLSEIVLFRVIAYSEANFLAPPLQTSHRRYPIPFSNNFPGIVSTSLKTWK
jgi:hypothetical protein